MSVQMELSRIIISEINDQQVVYLKEVEGDRTFPILIGLFEATSIDRRVKHHPSPRPLTHDLIVAVVDSLGGELQDVVISELKEALTQSPAQSKAPSEPAKTFTRRKTLPAASTTPNVAPTPTP